MQRILLSMVVCLVVAAQSIAQITISNANFYQAGDKLKMSTTTGFNNLPVTLGSAISQNWDFSMLTTGIYQEDTILAASTGAAYAQFPNTEILTPMLNFATAYTDVTTTAMTNLGAGIEIFGMGFVAPFSNPQTVQVAPLTYNTAFNDTYSLRFSTHVDSVPGLRQIISGLGLPISPDSIRVRVDGTTSSRVDAFGTLVAHDGTYNVLRQKMVVYNDIRIDAYVIFMGFGTWQDVTPMVSSMLPFPTKDTTYNYDYKAAGVKEPIVRQVMTSDGASVQRTEFKGRKQGPVAIQPVLSELSKVTVFPNPSQGQVQVRTEGINNYSISVVDVMGRNLYQENNIQQSQHSFILPNNLTQGNYWLMFYNEQGQLFAREQVTLVR